MARTVAAYYAVGDPFGVTGGFTTAPEISQMFGEIMGAWAADAWARTGSPPLFTLLECGPGRGTLMADVLRVGTHMPDFLDSARIVLLESSPELRTRQKETLKKYGTYWIESLNELPPLPVIVVANEFLDALPVRQHRLNNGHWEERVVHKGGLGWRTTRAGPPVQEGRDGTVWETSPARESFVTQLAYHIARYGGAAIFVDYGYAGPLPGDTLQAVKAHKHVGPLTPGADVTAHVDFTPLAKVARAAGLAVRGPVPQGAFLLRCGAAQRARVLGQEAELRRLTAPDQMGALFKVITMERALSAQG